MDVKLTLLSLIAVVGYANAIKDSISDQPFPCYECEYPETECGKVPGVYGGGYTVKPSYYGFYAQLKCCPNYKPYPSESIIYCSCDGEWTYPCGRCRSELAGKKFVAAFQLVTRHTHVTTDTSDLMIVELSCTVDELTTIKLTNNYEGTEQVYNVLDSLTVSFDPIMILKENGISNRTVWVEADKKCTCWAMVYRKTGAHIASSKWALRPFRALDKEYNIVSGTNTSQVYVVATEEGNTSCGIYKRNGVATAEFDLLKKQVYNNFRYNYGLKDITGYRVVCNKLVTVVAGATFTRNSDIYDGGSRDAAHSHAATDCEYSQLSVCAPFSVDLYSIKSICLEDDTLFEILDGHNGNVLLSEIRPRRKALNYDVFNNRTIILKSNKPCIVYQFSTTASSINIEESDHSMAECLPIKRWGNYYKFKVPDDFDIDNLKCIFRKDLLSKIKINGNPMEPMVKHRWEINIPGGETFLAVNINLSTNSAAVYVIETVNSEPFTCIETGRSRVAQYSALTGQVYEDTPLH